MVNWIAYVLFTDKLKIFGGKLYCNSLKIKAVLLSFKFWKEHENYKFYKSITKISFVTDNYIFKSRLIFPCLTSIIILTFSKLFILTHEKVILKPKRINSNKKRKHVFDKIDFVFLS